MKNKEIEELLKNIKDKYSYEPYDNTGNVYTTISYEEGQLLLSYIEQLEKKVELGDHYKNLYSEVKKQKDDAVEFIHKELDRFDCEGSMSISMRISYFEEDLLRMLGEIDDSN